MIKRLNVIRAATVALPRPLNGSANCLPSCMCRLCKQICKGTTISTPTRYGPMHLLYLTAYLWIPNCTRRTLHSWHPGQLRTHRFTTHIKELTIAALCCSSLSVALAAEACCWCWHVSRVHRTIDKYTANSLTTTFNGKCVCRGPQLLLLLLSCSHCGLSEAPAACPANIKSA